MIQFDPQALVQSLTDMTQALRDGGEGPSTVVQIQQGALSVKAAIGVSDFATNTPAGPDQTFEIGSQTKMMTSVMILQLVEKGLIDLDAPAASYLPPDTIAGLANADTATVRQLMNMTAGIANYTDAVNADGVPSFIAYLLDHPDSVFGPEQALAIARDMAPTGAPGESYSYSNTNYALLGQIVEGLTGQSFIAALQSHIFDPAGMTASVRQLSTDDPRLHSYAENPVTGDLMDVTRALWEMQGEAGVASTTGDMISFLQALLVDRTLLGPAALAEMMGFLPSQTGPGFSTGFGLGLLQAQFAGDGTYIGFAGGTLATDSSTFLNLDTGMITAIGSTTNLAASHFAGLELSLAAAHAPLWDAVVDDGGPVSVISGSAAEMQLHAGAEGLRFVRGGASLTLDRALTATTTQSLTFADGSVFVVGDNSAAQQTDARANDIDIRRDFAAALAHDNHLMGLGGNDTMRGGLGDDRIEGGRGDDVLRGSGGNDLLLGGQGNDRINGGAGIDTMVGGAGDDVFVFAQTAPGPDQIQDFQTGHDHIDLSAVCDLGHWIGAAAFSGASGEVRMVVQGHHTLISEDTNGDGSAELTIDLRQTTGIGATDFIF